jgi:hypothetical protein
MIGAVPQMLFSYLYMKGREAASKEFKKKLQASAFPSISIGVTKNN